MKLLLDQNLPRSLVAPLRSAFPESDHVLAFGLARATDREIFRFARENGFSIVSKDSDFRQLSFVFGAPPKVIWLRIGNRSADEIRRILSRFTQRILNFESEPESFLIIEVPEKEIQNG